MARLRKIETVDKELAGAFNNSIKDRIKIGKLINEARVILKSDNDYGEWLDKLSDQINTKTANRYMKLANCFSENLPDNIPLSGLYELSAKDDGIREDALEILGDTQASLQEVKDAIKQAKENQPKPSALEVVIAKIKRLSPDDSHDVFMTIIEMNGKETVMGWFTDTEQKEAA